MAIPRVAVVVAPVVVAPVVVSPVVVPDGRLRRCTFRRVALLAQDTRRRGVAAATYAVECLYPGPDAPLSLGDLATAIPACAACTAGGIFRPDET